MPITVHAHTSITNEEIRSQMERLYDTSPEFSDGHSAVQQLEQHLLQNTVLYTAEFNTKIIGAIWCSGQGESKRLHYIVVHPANRGRGVAERLISEVCRMQEEAGVKQFEPGCNAIQRSLMHLGKLG